MKKAKKTANQLFWEYCECGCHCHTASIGGQQFTLYNDLTGGYWLQSATSRTRYDSFEKANKAAFDLAQKEIEDTSGVVSTEEIRKLIKRAQRERYATNALAKTYKSKRDWVGYEGAIREALTLKRMETELKKLCETKHDHKDSQG